MSPQLASLAFFVFPIYCQWGSCEFRDGSAVPKRNKESEGGSRTLLISDNSDAMNSSLWGGFVFFFFLPISKQLAFIIS